MIWCPDWVGFIANWRRFSWYKMVTANSVKFSSVIFPSKTGEPSRSTFDAQSLLFGLPSRHDCVNTTISFVLLCVGTIWAAKHRTKVHYYAKTSRLPSTRSSDTYDLFWCLSSTSWNHVTWRHFWNGSIEISSLLNRNPLKHSKKSKIFFAVDLNLLIYYGHWYL